MPRRAEQWAADQFTVRRRLTRRDPSLLARGIGANITGSRADVVICDDVEVPNTCATALRREELRSAAARDQLRAGARRPSALCRHAAQLLFDLRRGGAREDGDAAAFLAGFERLCIPLLDARGESRWPERFTAEEIEEIRRRSGPAKFESQMLLRPRSVEDIRLDPALLVRYDAPLELREGNGESVLSIAGRRMVSASCWWDPAYGAPDAGDASVVAAVFVDDDGAYWLQDIRYLNHDPALTARGRRGNPAVPSGRRLREGPVPALGHDRDQWPGPFPAGPAAAGAAGARARLSGARACLHEQQGAADSASVRSAAGGRSAACPRRRLGVALHRGDARMAPRRRCRDDGLDAVSGCLLAEPVRLPRTGPGRRQDWRPGRSPHTAIIDFDP